MKGLNPPIAKNTNKTHFHSYPTQSICYVLWKLRRWNILFHPDATFIPKGFYPISEVIAYGIEQINGVHDELLFQPQ
jgi:hypothetical protein